ncbi:hypothetical protein L0F63_000046 [Massospora cicadina]|nr:hypothetical protein L0F63_000046 [Massospora cicadina]
MKATSPWLSSGSGIKPIGPSASGEAVEGQNRSLIYHQSVNLSTSCILNPPKRSNSIIPSKLAILRRLESQNAYSNVSFLARQMGGASVTRLDHQRSASVLASGVISRGRLDASKSMLLREPSFGPLKPIEFEGDGSKILDDSILSIGDPYENLDVKVNPFARNRAVRLATPRQPSHQIYRAISLNPFDILNKISLGEDRDYFEKGHFIPSLGHGVTDPAVLAMLRREITAMKEIERFEALSDSSDSDLDASGLFFDSDDSFHTAPVLEGAQNLNTLDAPNGSKQATPPPQKSLEEKVGEFLSAYRPLAPPSATRDQFNISRQIPLELSIKESCTFVSRSPLDCLLPPNQTDLEAYTRHLPECHSFSWAGCEISSTSVYQVLTTHHYPAAPRPKYLAAKIHELLSLSKARKTKLASDQSELLAAFAEMEAEWQDTFASLYNGCMADIVPYFYYINSDFSIVFCSPAVGRDIVTAHSGHPVEKPTPIAFLHGATPGLNKALRSRNIDFVTFLNPTTSQKKCAQEAIKPPKGSQLIFEGRESLQALFEFIYDWKNPKQALRCSDPPSLIAPTPFKRSQARLPKVSHSEVKSTDPLFTESAAEVPVYELKIDGLVLPTALKTLVRMLLGEQAKLLAADPAPFQCREFDFKGEEGSFQTPFQFKAYLKPHIDTLGLAGRWMLPAPALPYSEPLEMFDPLAIFPPPTQPIS